MPRPPSIRQKLEQDLWRRHPRFAQHHSDRRRPGPDQPLSWPDRALLLLAALLVLLLIVRVESLRAEEQETFWGIEGDTPGGSRALALNTEIRAAVTGLAARVTVTQWFYNPGPAWQEAVYRFPLPPGAAVDRLRVDANGRILEGEIREKGEARRQYQQARKAGQMGSLVEQQRPNQFETRLANIGPGEEIRVEIGFLTEVDYRNGRFSLSLPMTFTPRWDAPLTDAGLSPGAAQPTAPHPLLVADSGPDGHGLSVEVTLHAGLELARVDSRFHDIDIQPVSGGYRIELTDPEARSDRPFELGWTVAAGDLPQASAYTWDSGEAVYALLMLVPPLAETLSPTAREVVFVIDTSGSMEGTSIRQAREALRQGLAHLEPDDLFNLVRFDSDAELLFEASVPPSALEIGEAREYIDRLVTGGGTNMAPALELAMGLPARPGLLRQIVFITDGSVGNEQELLRQIGDRLGDSRLFTVSIGAAPNEWFMRKAAEIGRGTHRHIGRQDEVGQRMAELWFHLENPAVQGLCVDWGMQAEYYPEILPDLYAGEPLWLRAKLPFEPLEVTLCGELDGRHWEAASAVLPIAGGDTLGALWARSKIEALEDSRLFGMDAEAVRRDVLALALEFGLLTPWTSLVAVDRTPVRPVDAEAVTTEVPGLLPAGSTLSSGFPPTATAWPLRLGLALLSLSLASGMLLYRPRGRRRPAGTRQPGASLST